MHPVLTNLRLRDTLEHQHHRTRQTGSGIQGDNVPPIAGFPDFHSKERTPKRRDVIGIFTVNDDIGRYARRRSTELSEASMRLLTQRHTALQLAVFNLLFEQI